MLPFHILAWETDATLRATIEGSVQSTLAPIGTPSLLSGGELSCDARATGKRSVYEAEARARVARAFTLGPDGGPPDDSLDADATGTATWTLSPRSTLTFSAATQMATTWGIRAESLMLARDPFLGTPRLEYGFGGDLSWSWATTTRTELSVDAGVLQEGALAADVPTVVGADSREVHGGLSYSIDVGPRLSLAPEVRYAFTRYEHALLDVDRRRGRADVHSVSALVGGAREITPEASLTASLGVTVASPMPIAATGAPVLAPELGLGLRYRGRRAQLSARWSASYSSLGPRIGQGHQQSATLRFTAWPFAAAVGQGVVLRGRIRASHGVAPIGADPPPPMPGMPPPPLTGTVITTALAGHAAFEIPIARGWALITGADLVLTRGRMDPAPPGSEPRHTLTGMLIIGLSATLSTDKRKLFPPVPGADEDDARRGGAPAGAIGRAGDRTRIDVGRADGGDEER